MKPRTYRVLEMAVEYGVAYGWNRAHKHNDQPTDEQLMTAIEDAVMNSISEWFEIETGYGEEA